MEVTTIAEQLFFNTVRIDTTSMLGGTGSGTGFFISHEFEGNEYPFIVTNKHVVERTKEGYLNLIKSIDGKPRLGENFRLAFNTLEWNRLWIGHPDPNVDIAVCFFAPIVNAMIASHGFEPFFRMSKTSMIPNDEQMKGLDAVEAITFIGYPNGLWDRVNFLPIVRRGFTASPLSVDFEETPKFLIDASVFGGSSGSPVYILNQGSWGDKAGNLNMGSRIYFLGVIAAVYFRTEMNQVIPMPIPTNSVPAVAQHEMLDLGVVFKARTVVETIDSVLKGRVPYGQPVPLPNFY